MSEVSERFDCFGSTCGAFVIGHGREGSAEEAVALVRARLQDWHARFSRFLPDSELSRLNADAREEVPVAALMLLIAQSVRLAATITGGLVDCTMVDQIEAAGYIDDLGEPLPLARALALAPPRRPAAPDPRGGLAAPARRPRPPHGPAACGLSLDSGGIAKGLFADVLAARLADHASFAIDCGGDLAIGGSERIARAVEVESPFDASVAAHVRAQCRRRRDERHRPSQLARSRRAPGPPSARSGDR